MFMQPLEGRSKKAFYHHQTGLLLTDKGHFSYGKIKQVTPSITPLKHPHRKGWR